jgi:hypothetical protein
MGFERVDGLEHTGKNPIVVISSSIPLPYATDFKMGDGLVGSPLAFVISTGKAMHPILVLLGDVNKLVQVNACATEIVAHIILCATCHGSPPLL